MKRIRIERFLNKSLLYYTIYWSIYFLCFFIYRFSIVYYLNPEYTKAEAMKFSFLFNIFYFPFAILISHIITHIILPKFFFQNKVFLFSLITSLIVSLAPFAAYLLQIHVFDPFIEQSSSSSYNFSNYLGTIQKLIFCFAPIVWFKTSRFLINKEMHHQITENDKLRSELQLRETELKLLQSQLHPHFLFNTLNNLYSLSIQKSEKTSEVIIKISDMLNYIIYECNAEKVSLEKELEFIQSYLDLEKLRYDDSLRINASIIGDIKDKYIAPMILHTFIENSFKHGASKDTGNPWIEIILTVIENKLTFTVINSRTFEEMDISNGIGIENARKRLQLIYPDRHLLEIVTTKNTYNVSLEIQL